MTQEDLVETARKQPFEPFQVVLSTGETYDIRHPDLIMVGRRVAIIGIADDATQKFFDRSYRVDLRHIVGTRDLPAPTDSSTNGTP